MIKETNRTKFYNFALRRPFDLQLFADEGGEGNQGSADSEDPAGDDPEEGGSEPEDENKKPKYSEEDVQRILRRKTAEINKKRDKEEQSRDEARRLQSMSDEEKRDHEFKQLQQELADLKNERALSAMAKTARGLLERLKGKAPTAGSTGKKITKEEIMKVQDRRERQKLINEHMDLFTQK